MKDQGLPGIMQSLSGRTNCAETGVFQHGDKTKGALTKEQSEIGKGKLRGLVYRHISQAGQKRQSHQVNCLKTDLN